MMNNLDQLVPLLRELNTKIGVELVKADELSEGKRQIADLKEDMQRLMDVVTNPIGLENPDKAKETLVNLYVNLCDVIQDWQNIREIVITAGKRYSKNFLDDEKK